MRLRPNRVALPLLAAAVVVCSGTSAVAQPGMQGGQPGQGNQAGPAFRGLFGGNPNNGATPRRSSLDLSANLYGGYDDVLGATAENSSTAADSGMVGGSVGLSYNVQGRRTAFGASANAAARYYPDFENVSTVSNYGAGIGFSSALSRNTTLLVNQSVGYTPQYQWSFLSGLSSGVAPPSPGQGPYLNLDYLAADQRALSAGTYATLGHSFTTRSRLSGNYQLQYTDFLDSDPDETAPNLSYQVARLDYSYGLGQYASLVLGYGYQWGNYFYPSVEGLESDNGGHLFTAGVNYGRSFGLTRRTTFSFSTGATGTTYGLESENLYYTVVGNATLAHQFSPRWKGSVGYARNLGFTAGLYQPTVYDSVYGNLSAYLSTRSWLEFVATWSLGHVGFEGDANTYDTVALSALYQFALSRSTAVFAQYYYYTYTFDSGVVLPLGVASVSDRQGIRGGISFWLPLLQ